MSDHFGTLCIKGLTSIEDICPCSLEKPTVSCAILDGPVILNMLSPVNYSTFRDYAPKVFLPLSAINSNLAIGLKLLGMFIKKTP